MNMAVAGGTKAMDEAHREQIIHAMDGRLEVRGFADAPSSLAAIRTRLPNLVLTGYNMPGMATARRTAGERAARLRKRHPALRPARPNGRYRPRAPIPWRSRSATPSTR